VERSHAALWLLVGGAAALLVATLLALPGDVPGWERAVFRPVNDVALPYALVWPVMQVGNVLAVLVAVVAALALRRRWLALQLFLGGTAAYVLAKVLKDVVDRARPAGLLTDVHLHGPASAGKGYPSGHAAVAAALLCVLWPCLGRRTRVVAVAVAVGVCLARVHVGAHLPLDVVGGAALGVACAAVVRLLLQDRS
jgi:undecaprenyl-diphosphatase